MSMMQEWEWEQKGRHIADENHCQKYCSTATTGLSNMVANILGQLNKNLLTTLLSSKIEGRIKKKSLIIQHIRHGKIKKMGLFVLPSQCRKVQRTLGAQCEA